MYAVLSFDGFPKIRIAIVLRMLSGSCLIHV